MARLVLLCLCLFSCMGTARADEDPGLLRGQAESLLFTAREPKDFDAVIALLRRALKLNQERRRSQQDDPEVAHVRRLLGMAHMLRGTAADLDRASTELHAALRLREGALRGATAEYAQSLADLATLQSLRGENPAAEATYRRLLILQEQVLGADALEVAQTAGHLGSIYQDLGDIERAEAHYRRALTITEAHFAQGGAQARQGQKLPPPTEVLRYTVHLGVLAYHQGRLDEAAELLGRVKALAEERRWPERELAGLHALLGGLAQARGLPREAGGHYHRALLLLRDERGLSGEALWLARTQAARLHLQLAHFSPAESLGRQALAEAERLRGPRSREVGDLLSLLAAAVAGLGRGDEAAALLERALMLSERRLRAERYAFTEARLLSYLALLQHGEEAWIYTLLCRMKDGQPGKEEMTRLALAAALLRKGRAVDEVGAAGQALFRTLGGEGAEEFAQLRALRSQYAALSLAGPGALSPAAYQERLADLLAQADRLEETLLRRADARRALGPLSRSTVGPDPLSISISGQVAAALPADGALVELVLFHPREMDGLQPLDPNGGEGRYLALVLQPGPAGSAPQVLARDLGPAAVVNRAARRLLRALSDRGSPASAYQAPAAELARLIWEPLRPALRGRRAVFLSPDGALGLLPFAVLPEDGVPLLDRYQLSYLTSGRDLLPSPDRQPRPAAEAVIVADPDFTSSQPGPMAPLVSRPQRARSLLGWSFAPLPGTRREAEALLARFPASRVLLGEQATEAALLSLSAPGVLHVATHGLFIDDEAGARGGRGPAGVAVPGVEVPSPTPLLRAALVLAGAAGGAGRNEGADGLATALEVAGMDLWGTQLVVLSACDTGRGEAVPGQGVYGMRRAVMAAGAESLVTSLWRVDDGATAALMIAFYDGMLAGRGRAQALQEAAQQVRRSHPHPYYWAPFVLLGRVGPLLGMQVVRRPAREEDRPPDRRLYGVWAEGPGSIYVVGREGGLWRWDGARWRGGTGHGEGKDLHGIWGMNCPCGRREVMAVGEGGVALRWDGVRWARLISGTKEDLLSVWGDGPDRFYAVGRKGVALRWDGGRWHRVPTGTTMDLYGVRGIGTGGQLVMVGSGFTALLFERDAGGALVGPPRVLGPPPERLQRRSRVPALFSASGSATDLYAAGDGELWRWDGRRWDEVPLAPLGGSLRAVTGGGADVLAVGWRAAVRFDGKSWTRLPRETRQRTLHGIAGLGPGQAVAVGEDGLVLRWGEGGWRRLGGPPAEEEPWHFHAAWAPAGKPGAEGPVLVAGEEGEVWQGGSAGWQRLRAGSGGGESISGLWGFGEKDVYAVGPRGLLLHWDGATWRRGESGTTRSLSGVWGKGPADLYLVGEEGTLLHGGRSGAGWRFAQVPIKGGRGDAGDADLTGVWGADGKVLVVGLLQRGQALRGVALRGDARGVSAEEVGAVGPLFGVWAMDRGPAYAVGEEVVLRREGGRWRQVPGAIEGVTLHAVWGRGPGAVYAVGARSVDGVAVQIRERDLVPLQVGRVPRLLALWGQGKDLLVTGMGGTKKLLSPGR